MKKFLKIGIVSPYDMFRGGGVQIHIENLARELRLLGHTVKIISPRVNAHKTADVDHIPLGRCRKISWNKTETEVSLVLGGFRDPIKTVLEKEKFDILHFHEPWTPLLSLQLLAESDTVNVGTFHGVNTRTFFGKSMETILLPFAKPIVDSLDGVIAVSEAPKAFLKEFYEGYVHIIPNGINVDEFSPTKKPFKKYRDGKINIFFLGRMDKRKGLIYLLRAFRKLRKKRNDVRLLMAGKGTEYKSIQGYVKKYKIPDVELLGFVKEEDKPRWYATCDIYCSPAIYGESFGIVLLEAMSTGRPAIAASNPGYRSVLRKGMGGLLLVVPESSVDILDKLEILCNSPELRNMFGKWGIEEAKNYSWDKVAKSVENVYKESIREANIKKLAIKEKAKKRNRMRVWTGKMFKLLKLKK